MVFRFVRYLSSIPLGSCVLAAILTPVPAFSQEEVPEYKILSCAPQCSNWTEPELLSRPKAIYPTRYRAPGSTPTDALVDTSFTVTADGRTKDIKVISLVGPETFARSAIHAVEQSTYRPAVENGEPVEQKGRRVRFRFFIKGVRGVSTEVSNAYTSAINLERDGKTSDAIAILNRIVMTPEMNFYGRCSIANALAIMYSKLNDTDHALYFNRLATLDGGKYLAPSTRDEAMRRQIELETASHQYADALQTFDLLRKIETISDDDPAGQLARKAREGVAASGPIYVRGWIRDSSMIGAWQHQLFRHSFAFKDATGKLDHFELSCDRHEISSTVVEGTVWAIPNDWGQCHLYVLGAAESTFQLVEK